MDSECHPTPPHPPLPNDPVRVVALGIWSLRGHTALAVASAPSALQALCSGLAAFQSLSLYFWLCAG